MNCSTRISSLALGVLLPFLAVGCSSTQTVGEELDDAAITTTIEAKMAANHDVSAWNVDADTNGGVVRLSGTVETARAKAEAEKIARDTKGVNRVHNMLEVENS